MIDNLKNNFSTILNIITLISVLTTLIYFFVKADVNNEAVQKELVSIQKNHVTDYTRLETMHYDLRAKHNNLSDKVETGYVKNERLSDIRQDIQNLESRWDKRMENQEQLLRAILTKVNKE